MTHREDGTRDFEARLSGLGQITRSHVLSAVDVNLCAVDVGAGIGAEHINDLGDLVGRAEPVKWDLLIHNLLGAR